MADSGPTRAGGRALARAGLVFTTRAGTTLEPRNIACAFKAFLKQGGLPDIRFHDLCYSCASLLIAVGHHPRVVIEILGHSQIGITMEVYSHVYSRAQDAMAATTDALFVAAAD